MLWRMRREIPTLLKMADHPRNNVLYTRKHHFSWHSIPFWKPATSSSPGSHCSLYAASSVNPGPSAAPSKNSQHQLSSPLLLFLVFIFYLSLTFGLRSSNFCPFTQELSHIPSSQPIIRFRSFFFGKQRACKGKGKMIMLWFCLI